MSQLEPFSLLTPELQARLEKQQAQVQAGERGVPLSEVRESLANSTVPDEFWIDHNLHQRPFKPTESKYPATHNHAFVPVINAGDRSLALKCLHCGLQSAMFADKYVPAHTCHTRSE